ncbi:hypothetical protein EAO70_16610 [Streptomyces sp. adm13(2018)]|uniref:hypothetical protein n=1 Tax=Streptomyces sp. adm13(2018) TaxID=2479007 RepID=UPI0011CE398C|nr:hypothetical protein [Streptomyces sp. adm13(2018)]TXS15336.1 hypothetical protein EAO70_16610 [Streptomyces sp. adm13(2018)]
MIGKAVVLSGPAATGGLVWAGAPWSVVAVVAVLGVVVAGLILTLLIAFPDDSEHKRDVWMARTRYRGRREERALRKREERAVETGGTRAARSAEAEGTRCSPVP